MSKYNRHPALTVHVEQDLLDRLDAVVRQTGTTRTEIVVDLLEALPYLPLPAKEPEAPPKTRP